MAPSSPPSKFTYAAASASLAAPVIFLGAIEPAIACTDSPNACGLCQSDQDCAFPLASTGTFRRPNSVLTLSILQGPFRILRATVPHQFSGVVQRRRGRPQELGM